MSMYSPPRTHLFDRDTYVTAIAIMKQHGDRATEFAAKQSTKRERRADPHGSQDWDEIIVAILELERTWLRADESCN